MEHTGTYITLRVRLFGYQLASAESDPYDDERVQLEDNMLQRALIDIFREHCPTVDKVQEYLSPDGYGETINLILDREPGLSGIFPEGSNLSLLWASVLLCYQKSAELLVRCGADVNERCDIKLHRYPDENLTLLHMLNLMYPSAWNERMIRLMMEYGANLHERDWFGCTILHYAAKKGRTEVVRTLLERGVDVNVADHNGRTPLLEAARSSDAGEPMLRLLLEYGADTTCSDKNRQNALHFLATALVEHVDVARDLIQQGVSLDQRDHLELQPFHVAVRDGNIGLVKLFLDHGVDVNGRVDDDVFPLSLAACKEKPEVTRTLLERGADVEMKSKEGRTALHTACWYLVEENVKTLLFFGADPFVEDQGGDTPLALVLSFMDNSLEHRRVKLTMIKSLALAKVGPESSITPSVLKEEKRIRTFSKMWSYYRDCLSQAHELKSTKITESCNFLELMTKCKCQIATLMRNPDFERKFELNHLEGFPTYADDVLRAFERAQCYCRSVQKQEEIINKGFNKMMPDVIVRELISYLIYCEDCQLKRIVQASRGRARNSNFPREVEPN